MSSWRSRIGPGGSFELCPRASAWATPAASSTAADHNRQPYPSSLRILPLDPLVSSPASVCPLVAVFDPVPDRRHRLQMYFAIARNSASGRLCVAGTARRCRRPSPPSAPARCPSRAASRSAAAHDVAPAHSPMPVPASGVMLGTGSPSAVARCRPGRGSRSSAPKRSRGVWQSPQIGDVIGEVAAARDALGRRVRRRGRRAARRASRQARYASRGNGRRHLVRRGSRAPHRRQRAQVGDQVAHVGVGHAGVPVVRHDRRLDRAVARGRRARIARDRSPRRSTRRCRSRVGRDVGAVERAERRLDLAPAGADRARLPGCDSRSRRPARRPRGRAPHRPPHAATASSSQAAASQQARRERTPFRTRRRP